MLLRILSWCTPRQGTCHQFDHKGKTHSSNTHKYLRSIKKKISNNNKNNNDNDNNQVLLTFRMPCAVL